MFRKMHIMMACHTLVSSRLMRQVGVGPQGPHLPRTSPQDTCWPASRSTVDFSSNLKSSFPPLFLFHLKNLPWLSVHSKNMLGEMHGLEHGLIVKSHFQHTQKWPMRETVACTHSGALPHSLPPDLCSFITQPAIGYLLGGRLWAGKAGLRPHVTDA